jgi:hypothetical protein
MDPRAHYLVPEPGVQVYNGTCTQLRNKQYKVCPLIHQQLGIFD